MPLRWLTHFDSVILDFEKAADAYLGIPVDDAADESENDAEDNGLYDAESDNDIHEPVTKKTSAHEGDKEECLRWWLEVLKKASKSKEGLKLLKQSLMDTFETLNNIEIEEAKHPESRIKLPWE